MRPALALVLILAAAVSLPALASASVKPRYATVRPLAGRPVTILNRPGGHVVATLERSLLDRPLVLSVVGHAGRYLAVTSEEIPNGRHGWVVRSAVRVGHVTMALQVDLSKRRLMVYSDGVLVRRFAAAVGAHGSPTPTGRFSVAEKVPGSRFGAAYGCCILGLTAHQTHPPAGWAISSSYYVAIHGGGGLGGAVSAGCLHLSTPALRYLMRRAPLGTPVFIHA